MQVLKDLTEIQTRKIVFRVDASIQIGSGHLMRCLTLANEGLTRGWKSFFVMRDADLEIQQKISSFGHEFRLLRAADDERLNNDIDLMHSHWLSVSQRTDAAETLEIVLKVCPDWIIVDHYAIDAAWHTIVKEKCDGIMVIDDLADRKLDCDILLNQNLGFSVHDYSNKIVGDCELLLGADFALLRPEFREWRQRSLKRRSSKKLNRVLISMGGVDANNHSLTILKELAASVHAKQCEFTIVLGSLYPFHEEIDEFIDASELSVSKITDANNMAEIMSFSDICIGAAGSSTLERCCLGLPNLMVSIAKNQDRIACDLQERGVAILTASGTIARDFDTCFEAKAAEFLVEMSAKSSAFCDGEGAKRVIEKMEAFDGRHIA